MVEHTQVTTPDVIEVTRPVAVGEGVVRADEDVARRRRDRTRGPTAARPGPRPPRRGRCHRGGRVHARPTGGDHLHRRRGGAARAPGRCSRVRCATPPPPRWRRWSPRQAASRRRGGSCPTTLEALTKTLAGGRCTTATSSSSRPGRRSAPATRPTAAVESLGGPGIYCHGLAIKPGKPTLLAECSDVPVIGLPGQPVVRAGRVPHGRAAGASPASAASPGRPRSRPRTATLSRECRLGRGSARRGAGAGPRGRRIATPLFGFSALLSILTDADGYVVIPEAATGLERGIDVTVTMYR